MTVSRHGAVIEYKALPQQLGRVRSVEALYSVWRRMQDSVCLDPAMGKMPRAVTYLARRIYDITPEMAAEAIRHGDVATFVAVAVRLDGINSTLAQNGRTIAERSAVIYARHIVAGFQAVAEESFVKLGGYIPPAPAEQKTEPATP